jgi:hypothetical protein
MKESIAFSLVRSPSARRGIPPFKFDVPPLRWPSVSIPSTALIARIVAHSEAIEHPPGKVLDFPGLIYYRRIRLDVLKRSTVDSRSEPTR